MTQLKFVDISFSQGAVNWDAIEQAYKNGEIGGVIIRSGYGGGGVDDQFRRNQREARNRNIPRQFYFFAYPGRSGGAAQAQEHYNIVGQLQVGESISIDMEDEPTYGRRLINSDVQWAHQWLNTAKGLFGLKPLIYMNSDVLGRYNWIEIKNDDYALWLANYGANNGQPNTQPNTAPWDFAAFWQFTSRGNIAGISPVDISIFNGTSDQFLKYGSQGTIQTPALIPIPASAQQPSNTYTVHGSQRGYYTGDDALAHRNSNSVVAAGIYSIFNVYKGMVNITRIAGQAGWWVNPTENGQPSPAPVGQIYTVVNGDSVDHICTVFKIDKSNNYAAYRAMNPNGGHNGHWTNIWAGDKVRIS
jgi:GH25 family lysozyme M1 (1,4-beta-N-acetylmuramidase)